MIPSAIAAQILRRRGATHAETSVHRFRISKYKLDQEHKDDHTIDRLNKYQLLIGVISVLLWMWEFALVVGQTQSVNTPSCTFVNSSGESFTSRLPHELTYEFTPLAQVLEGIYSCMTGALFWMVYHHYKVLVVVDNRRMNIAEGSESIWRSRFRWNYIFETLLVGLQPIPFLASHPPFYMDKKSEFVNTQLKVGLFMFFRLYPILRVIRDKSFIYQRRREIGKMMNVEPDFFSSFYVFKASFNKSPALVTSICTLLSLFMVSLSLYVAEWSVYTCGTGEPDPFTLQDAIYLCIITLTSVGYGDVKPLTHFGKAVAVVSAWIGVILSSLQVEAVNRRLEMGMQERCSDAWMWSRIFHHREKNAASIILQVWWRNVLSRVYGKHYLKLGILKIPGHQKLFLKDRGKDVVVTLQLPNESEFRATTLDKLRAKATGVLFSDNAKSRRAFSEMRRRDLDRNKSLLRFNEAMEVLHRSGIVKPRGIEITQEEEGVRTTHGHYDTDGSCKFDAVTQFNRRLDRLNMLQFELMQSLNVTLRALQTIAPAEVARHKIPDIFKTVRRHRHPHPMKKSGSSSLLSMTMPKENKMDPFSLPSSVSAPTSNMALVQRVLERGSRLQPISNVEYMRQKERTLRRVSFTSDDPSEPIKNEPKLAESEPRVRPSLPSTNEEFEITAEELKAADAAWDLRQKLISPKDPPKTPPTELEVMQSELLEKVERRAKAMEEQKQKEATISSSHVLLVEIPETPSPNSVMKFDDSENPGAPTEYKSLQTLSPIISEGDHFIIDESDPSVTSSHQGRLREDGPDTQLTLELPLLDSRNWFPSLLTGGPISQPIAIEPPSTPVFGKKSSTLLQSESIRSLEHFEELSSLLASRTERSSLFPRDLVSSQTTSPMQAEPASLSAVLESATPRQNWVGVAVVDIFPSSEPAAADPAPIDTSSIIDAPPTPAIPRPSEPTLAASSPGSAAMRKWPSQIEAAVERLSSLVAEQSKIEEKLRSTQSATPPPHPAPIVSTPPRSVPSILESLRRANNSWMTREDISKLEEDEHVSIALV